MLFFNDFDEPVGDDGLTDRERQAAMCRYQETAARRPTPAELQQLHQRLAERAAEPMCRRRSCRHPRRAHERHTASDHCAWCGSSGCKTFLPPRPSWWPRRAR